MHASNYFLDMVTTRDNLTIRKISSPLFVFGFDFTYSQDVQYIYCISMLLIALLISNMHAMLCHAMLIAPFKSWTLWL